MFNTSDIPEFDVLIANPPYIRTQVLGAEHAKLLSKNFGLNDDPLETYVLLSK